MIKPRSIRCNSINLGVSVRINESVTITEGEIQDICVELLPVDQLPERYIPFVLSVVPMNQNSGTMS